LNQNNNNINFRPQIDNGNNNEYNNFNNDPWAVNNFNENRNRNEYSCEQGSWDNQHQHNEGCYNNNPTQRPIAHREGVAAEQETSVVALVLEAMVQKELSEKARDEEIRAKLEEKK